MSGLDLADVQALKASYARICKEQRRVEYELGRRVHPERSKYMPMAQYLRARRKTLESRLRKSWVES